MGFDVNSKDVEQPSGGSPNTESPQIKVSHPSADSDCRLRILHVINDLSVGGAEVKLNELLAAMNRKRFAPAVLSLKDRGELGPSIESLGVPVYTLGIRRSLPGPMSVLRLIRIARRLRPDVIHGWMYHGNLAAQVARGFLKKKARVVWSVHQSLYNFDHEKALTAAVIRLGARLSRMPEGIIYISEISAIHHEGIGYDRAKRLVFSYGFDTEKFAPSPEARRSLRAELGVEQNTILVGMVGRYHAIKCHANFLRAAAAVSVLHPRTHFVLCGKDVDDNNNELGAVIRELQIARRVHLLGQRQDIHRVIAALDVNVLSSYSEGFPSVIGEAMSSSVPCVSTDVGEVAEIVGPTGRVVPRGDPQELAAAIGEMILIGAERRSVLGMAARKRIKENYSLELAVLKYEKLYEELHTRQADVIYLSANETAPDRFPL